MKSRYVVPTIVLTGILGAALAWSMTQSQLKSLQASHAQEIAAQGKRIAELERLVEQQQQQIQSLSRQASPFLLAAAQSRVSNSKGNLKYLATALESHFVDRGHYPASLRDLIPTYMRQYLLDPCTNSPYDYYPAGTPPKDYRLTITFPAGNACASVLPGLSYTPGNGLQENP